MRLGSGRRFPNPYPPKSNKLRVSQMIDLRFIRHLFSPAEAASAFSTFPRGSERPRRLRKPARQRFTCKSLDWFEKDMDDFANEQLGLGRLRNLNGYSRGGRMEDKRLAANPSGLCVCGCGRKTKIVTKSDRRHGHVMGQPFRFIHGHSRPAAKGPNRFKLRRRTAVIFLERRDGTVLECLVSRKDFHRVRRHRWYSNNNGKLASYAIAWIDGAQVQMHKHLCPNWAQIKHQNGNGLDNRRENLCGVRRAA